MTDATRATRLSFDSTAAQTHLSAADPILGQLMARCGPYRPATTAAPDVFHSLMRAIVYQQLSGKAAGTIHQRVLAALGNGDAPGPHAILATDTDTLRAAGLSANKEASLRALATAQAANELPDESRLGDYDDAELITAYSAIRGIGRWTVEMLLLFHLGRPDVMPIHDLGIRKGYALTYGLTELPKPKALEADCEIWRPYRSVGSWFMWRALEAEGAAPQPG
ncbi:DNA-3-methyladenine glycosylase [Salinisphaera sp. Q1T1-3]|uniref:DNA-3-methyladenine glycosylase family protein n=1 Tax=Salinisphaera sp. Q1T1-3 TaxID=2321229 RepID=UPI000E766957|nr:DNA-3-methyladenine glycosylase [Salinisphaera sp. Q1T1-3]RJS93754.1 DNA-3-methyladenine glycosylase 2 family protein [Salinisphaera sp. Q1T1-3]